MPDQAFIMLPQRKPFLGICDRVLVPTIRERDLKPVVAKDVPMPGSVPDQIVESIRSAVVCVAELTGNNPNVLYEVAYAHSMGKPVILITQESPEKMPFDIRHHRVIQYENNTEGLVRLAGQLADALNAVIERRELPIDLLRQMLVPRKLVRQEGPFIVAASPLSYRAAYKIGGGYGERPAGTYGDHIGIRGLMQTFGLIFGLDRLPELLDPDDFKDGVLEGQPGNMYTIASPKANRLTGEIMGEFFADRSLQWRFAPDPEATNLKNPKVLLMLHGRSATWTAFQPAREVPDGRLIYDFGVVIRGPRPGAPEHMVMVLAGRSARGTEAACLAVTDPYCLQTLSEDLKRRGADLEEPKQAFCAVVSVQAAKNTRGRRDPNLGPDRESFCVETASVYE